MYIIPSLYLQDGKIVSWYKGRPNEQKKIYYKDPLHMARVFEGDGAKRIQIIDLNGSQTGERAHKDLIKRICQTVEVEVQLGGGIRTMEAIQEAFDLGVDEVVLGVSSLPILKEAIENYGGEKIILGIKGHQDTVETDLTLEGKTPEVTELAKEVIKVGVRQIIYKDLEKEGALYHPNFDMTEQLLYETEGQVEIYTSGGITDEYDVKLLKKTGAAGVVIGRALMEGKLNLKQLIEKYQD